MQWYRTRRTNSGAIINANFTHDNARCSCYPITQYTLLLGCLFNSLDSPSSLHEDVPINSEVIGCLHVESASCILLTYREHHKRLIVFVAECQPRSSDFSLVFTLEI